MIRITLLWYKPMSKLLLDTTVVPFKLRPNAHTSFIYSPDFCISRVGEEMPPNSFVEWTVGRNILRHVSKGRRPASGGQRLIIRAELTTDDESEQDTIHITYPARHGDRLRQSKVRFWHWITVLPFAEIR